MSTRTRLPLGSLLLLGAWACSDDEPATGPSAEPAGTTAAAVTYVIRDLGTLGGAQSHAYDINSAGTVVGTSNVSGATLPHAFVWKNGVMTDIGTLGGTYSAANGINRAGVVVGVSTTASGERHAFRWKDGVFKDLGTMGRMYSLATAINTKGQIVGTLGPTPDAVGDELDMVDNFLYYQEVMTRVTNVSRRLGTFPRDIGPTGIIVGLGQEGGDEARDENAWWIENGTGGILPTLDPTIQLDNHSGAEAVNRAGTIVGVSKTSSGQYHAVLWRRQ